MKIPRLYTIEFALDYNSGIDSFTTTDEDNCQLVYLILCIDSLLKEVLLSYVIYILFLSLFFPSQVFANDQGELVLRQVSPEFCTHQVLEDYNTELERFTYYVNII